MGTTASGTGLMAGSAAAASPAAAGAAMQPVAGAGALGAGIGSQQLVGNQLSPLLQGSPTTGGAGAAGGGAGAGLTAGADSGTAFNPNLLMKQLGGMAGQMMGGGGGRMALPGPMPGGAGGSPFGQMSSPFRSRQGPQSGQGLLAEMYRHYGGV
ncbi:MAG: hypothetical protein KC933_23460 [Myxococcales bacterium]|nr:hypothetical protein [Myxococcales bacterium]